MPSRILGPLVTCAFLLPATLLGAAREPSGDPPLFRFGLIADIQYADKNGNGKRNYRESLAAFRRCVEGWRGQDLSFTAQLGDLIDGRGTLAETREDLDAVLGVYASLPEIPHRHVIGNHCLSVPRPELERRLGLTASWYAFDRPGWRFIVLDAMDLSLMGRPEGSPQYQLATEMLDTLKTTGAENAQPWNGGISQEQLDWLDRQLADADRIDLRAVVLSHLPVLTAASSEYALVWNHEAVREILNAHPSTHAYLAGHDHTGGYAVEGAVHHLTVPGMVEAPIDGDAFSIVSAFEDRLEIDGVGDIADLTLSRIDAE